LAQEQPGGLIAGEVWLLDGGLRSREMVQMTEFTFLIYLQFASLLAVALAAALTLDPPTAKWSLIGLL